MRLTNRQCAGLMLMIDAVAIIIVCWLEPPFPRWMAFVLLGLFAGVMRITWKGWTAYMFGGEFDADSARLRDWFHRHTG